MQPVMQPVRYMLVSDIDCRWCYIPESRKADWEAWEKQFWSPKSLAEIDEKTPDFAVSIDSPKMFTFTDPSL